MKKIIYTNSEGNVSVMTPEYCGLTIEEIIAKDIPPIITVTPRPYKIIGTIKQPVIVYTDNNGIECAVTPDLSYGQTIEEIAFNVVPQIVTTTPRPYEIIDATSLPRDGIFRSAWEISGKTVVESLTKARDISHDIRRQSREIEMKPLDILALDAATAKSAESIRVVIREKYADIQVAIDAAIDVDALRSVVSVVSVVK